MKLKTTVFFFILLFTASGVWADEKCLDCHQKINVSATARQVHAGAEYQYAVPLEFGFA